MILRLPLTEGCPRVGRSHDRLKGVLDRLAPRLVGGCVAAILVVLAPRTQPGLDPARDLGPRIVASAAGVRP